MRLLPIYGLMAEFEDEEHLLEAGRRAYGEGYRNMDAYSPSPIEGMAEAIGYKKNVMSPIVLAGALTGAIGGFFLQYWISAINYPINVGGRPYNSWPSFIPITFEMTVLFGSLFAFFGLLAVNGLPMPYHPVFNVPNFQYASRNRFFLCIEARDPQFDKETTREFLESLNAREVSEVNQ
jgi:hypothetical protein